MNTLTGRKAEYIVVEAESKPGEPLVIKDLHPSGHPTVTNDAEGVVEELVASGRLRPFQRLLYYDTEGRLDELLVLDGRFAGFNLL